MGIIDSHDKKNSKTQERISELEEALLKTSSLKPSDYFQGQWNSVYEVPGSPGKARWVGKEGMITFSEDNIYSVDGKRMFKIDMIDIDKDNGLIKFRKISLDGGLTERITCDLRVINENQIIGVEDNVTTGNNIRITYSKNNLQKL